MDILLINPPWITKDGNLWHGVKSTSPPLGLLYVAAREAERNAHKAEVKWRFTTDDARIKLKKLYPSIEG